MLSNIDHAIVNADAMNSETNGMHRYRHYKNNFRHLPTEERFRARNRFVPDQCETSSF